MTDYSALADELNALGQGTPQWAMPEAIGAGADAIRELLAALEAAQHPIELPQYSKVLRRAEQAEATIQRVQAAGRAIVLNSFGGKTIIHDAGIMQDDATMIAEALRGKPIDRDEETEESLYVQVGFLSEEETR